MAAVVLKRGADFSVAALWAITQALPLYAQPRFVGVLEALSTTGTFKVRKTVLRKDGVDPATVTNPLYVRGVDPQP